MGGQRQYGKRPSTHHHSWQPARKCRMLPFTFIKFKVHENFQFYKTIPSGRRAQLIQNHPNRAVTMPHQLLHKLPCTFRIGNHQMRWPSGEKSIQAICILQFRFFQIFRVCRNTDFEQFGTFSCVILLLLALKYWNNSMQHPDQFSLQDIKCMDRYLVGALFTSLGS